MKCFLRLVWWKKKKGSETASQGNVQSCSTADLGYWGHSKAQTVWVAFPRPAWVSTSPGNLRPPLDNPFTGTEKGTRAFAPSEASCKPLAGPFWLSYTLPSYGTGAPCRTPAGTHAKPLAVKFVCVSRTTVLEAAGRGFLPVHLRTWNFLALTTWQYRADSSGGCLLGI